MTANHRINDAVANEDGPQVLTGRFMYGPLDMVTLTGEKVRTPGDGGALRLAPSDGAGGAGEATRPRVTSPPDSQVDVHIMMQPPSGEWLYLDTLVTNSSGRVSYTIPETRRLGVGVYPVKMVVRWVPGRGALSGAGAGPRWVLTSCPPRGDHTFADSYITVLPKGTEFVVFSIDGSFAASVSIMGSDPKVRAGAVDVVR